MVRNYKITQLETMPYFKQLVRDVYRSLKYCMAEMDMPEEKAMEIFRDVTRIFAQHCLVLEYVTED